MRRTRPKVRRQMMTLFCALLLFGQIFIPAAYADREQNVNISYTVTEDMLPKPVPIFGQIFIPAAYADREQNVNISYTVTEDMLPKPVPSSTPTPTATPTATPHPGKGEPPKTGDESQILLYGLAAAGSALAALGVYVYLNKKKETGRDE